MDTKLAPATKMGAVTLFVGDLDAMTAFYRHVITLQVLREEKEARALGRAGKELVILRHDPTLKHAARGSAGLYHTAILFETEAALAAALYSVAQRAPQLFTGSADHLVSKAFYLNDPEGNGIELYWDRDRTEWSWVHGRVEMATLYVDPNAFLREHLTEEAAAGSTESDAAEIGHVHLSVGDTQSAREFYVDKLGFDVTAELGGSALFVSAGGYHHHMAMNIWESTGAGPRMPALGLGQVDLALPDADALGELGERLAHFKTPVADDGKTLSFTDPWNNTLLAAVA